MITKHKTTKGFTLIEMMISIFIFVIVMTAIVTVFASHISASAYAREVQRNLENAQFAFNYMAKTFRTSAIAAGAYGDDNKYTSYTEKTQENVTDIYLYDYSQSKCFHFFFDSNHNEHGAIAYQSSAFGVQETQDVEQCAQDTTYKEDPVYLTTGDIEKAQFTYTPSQRGSYEEDLSPAHIGYVTMSARIADRTAEQGHVWMQTSVSLRDYPGELSF